MSFKKFQNGLLAAGAAAIGLVASSAQAQVATVGAGCTFPSNPVVAPFYPYYGGGTVAGGTAAGSINFGTGVGIGAAASGLGDYNLKTGMGLQYREAARKQYIENTVQAVEAFYDRRRVHGSYALETRTPPLSPEDAARIARERSAELNDDQVNPLTGRVAWPTPLMDEQFDADRKQVETLLATRGPLGGDSGRSNAREIRQATSEMMAKLKAATFGQDEPTFTSYEYIEAKQFLDGMRREAANMPRQNVDAVALN